jgi:hypothetical protein
MRNMFSNIAHQCAAYTVQADHKTTVLTSSVHRVPKRQRALQRRWRIRMLHSQFQFESYLNASIKSADIGMDVSSSTGEYMHVLQVGAIWKCGVIMGRDPA